MGSVYAAAIVPIIDAASVLPTINIVGSYKLQFPGRRLEVGHLKRPVGVQGLDLQHNDMTITRGFT